MKKIILLLLLLLLSFIFAEYDKLNGCCDIDSGYVKGNQKVGIPFNFYLEPTGTWEELHEYGVNNNPVCEGNGINAHYNAGNPVPGTEG